jgi:hypothetical protein
LSLNGFRLEQIVAEQRQRLAEMALDHAIDLDREGIGVAANAAIGPFLIW